MDFNRIDNFLDKFKKIFLQKEEEVKTIVIIINKHTTIQIDEGSIKVKGFDIYIQGSPALRNEILIHKDGILSDLNNILQNKKIYKIH